MTVTLKALMLRSVDYKDNDKILTLFSNELGKIATSIRGVKKAEAKLKFLAQPFCFAEYVLAQKDDRYTVISGTLIESFYDLRLDISKLYAGYVVTEICDKLYMEGVPSNEMFLLCLETLKEISIGDEYVALNSYIIKTLHILGYGFSVDKCIKCGQLLTDNVNFDFESSNFTCENCKDGKAVTNSTFNNIKKYLGEQYNEKEIEQDAEIKLLKFLYAYLKYKFECEFESLSSYLVL